MIWVNRPTSPDAIVCMAINGESLTGAGAPRPGAIQGGRSINEAWADYNKEVPRAKGEADQAVRAAEGYALERVNKAEGVRPCS